MIQKYRKLCVVSGPLDLVSERENHQNATMSAFGDKRIPGICLYAQNALFFAHRQAAAGRFLALSAAWHAGDPACTLRRKCGPWPGSVARALGVQSRDELALFAGSFSSQPEPIRSMETPKCPSILFFDLYR